MPNLSDIFFRTLIDGTQTDVSISGVKTPWTGTGTPWTAAATSPYEIAMNDRTGQRWTPRATQPTAILSGGPYADVIDAPVDVITETIPIQFWATTYDQVLSLKTYLQRVLTNQAYAPVALYVKPYGATQYVVFDVLDGAIQELPALINDEAGRGFARATVTLTRRPWGMSDTSVNALTSSSMTVGNSPLATPDNLTPLTTAAYLGDALARGQPLNLSVTPNSATIMSRIWLATIADRTAPTSSTTTTYSTSSTSFTTARTVTIDATPCYQAQVKPRAMARIANATANVRVQLWVDIFGTYLYRSPVLTPSAGTTLIDFGTWPMDMVRRARTLTPKIRCLLGFLSADGAAASLQYNWLEMLWYYDFCRIEQSISGSAGNALHVDQFIDLSNSWEQAMPRLLPPTASVYNALNTTVTGGADTRGTLPRLRRLSSSTGGLWCGWLSADGSHSTTEQATLTARHLPIYHSLRGAL